MTKVIIEEIFPRPDLIDLPPPVAGANDVRSLRLLVVVCFSASLINGCAEWHSPPLNNIQ